ncbi:MAG TPA: methyltransferase domain-containing protein [Victivallales bacterium]|nr:methyltransferase domain-containing protein [Victivallales bacterium]
MKADIEKLVKISNREVYNNISPEEYDKNESIFNETRRKNCEEALRECANRSGNESYLDVGTGTGNLLRISQNIFKNTYAIDISENMLIKIKDRHSGAKFAASDAENLPFKDSSFNCVSANALLHHLVSHEKLLSEIFRVLKPGGSLYTDHDPNYFFNRFYRIFYRIKFRNRHGFGNEKNDLAEYHNVFTPGINPEQLAMTMREIGFSKIKIKYRLTDRSEWKGFAKFAFILLKILNKSLPFKSLRTHFSIIASKN